MSHAEAGVAPAVEPEEADAPQQLFTPLTGVVAVLVLVCFAPYLQWMWDIWMRSPYYGHGPLIPLISAYLIYARRHDFVKAEAGTSVWGLRMLAFGLMLYVAAVYGNVNFPQGFALILVIAGLLVLLFGWGRARTIAFPIAFLGFMVPLDRVLVTQFSDPMQLWAARLASSVPAVLGVPVTLHGATIMVPDYTFEVAQACSGLKSVIAMSALAALFAYLVAAPVWKRLTLFAAGFPIALLANAARIAFTVLLGRSLGTEAAEGFFHTFSGMLVFLLAVGGLFGAAKVLKCDRMREDIW